MSTKLSCYFSTRIHHPPAVLMVQAWYRSIVSKQAEVFQTSRRANSKFYMHLCKCDRSGNQNRHKCRVSTTIYHRAGSLISITEELKQLKYLRFSRIMFRSFRILSIYKCPTLGRSLQPSSALTLSRLAVSVTWAVLVLKRCCYSSKIYLPAS